jgi:ADP-ribosylation factor related protein 1
MLTKYITASFTQKPRYNVLLLGISGSGKSAWLDKVRSRVTKTGSRSLSRFHPTVGQNVLDLNLAHTTLHFWDLGGEESLRRLWSRYYDEANVLVWAMDSQDWAALALKGSSEEAYITEDSTDELAMREARRQESWRALGG